jgi:hypothetical protein
LFPAGKGISRTMSRKFLYPLSAGLLAYCLFIIWKYGSSYPESPGLADFAGFAGFVIVAKLLVVLALSVSAYGYGSRLFARWTPAFGSLVEEWLVKSALGLIVVSYIMFLLGLVHALYLPVGYVVLAVGLIAGAGDIAGFIRRTSGMKRTVGVGFPLVVLTALSVYFMLKGLYGAYLPPAGFDVLMYHLGVPRLYLNAHSIYTTPDINGSYFPFGIEMLYMLGMMIGGAISANLVNYGFAVMGGLAAAAFCMRHLKESSEFVAFAVYVSVPMVVWLMPQAYIEFGLAAYTMLALLALAAGISMKDRKWMLVAAVFAGFSMAIKYTGVITVGFFVVWVFAERVFVDKSGLKRALASAGMFCGLAVLAALPWYVKNLIVYHNPVYPFFPVLFGNAGAMRPGGSLLTLLSGDALTVAYRFISSFWETTFNARAFQMGWANGFGPVFLMLVPGALLFGRPRRPVVMLLLFCLTYFSVVILGANIRYSLPMLPALSVLAAYPIGRLIKDDTSVTRAFGYALLSVFAFAALMSSTPLQAVSEFPSSSRQATERYYSEGRWSGYLASYDAWRWINVNLPKDAVIYQLWDDASVYFRQRMTIGSPLAWDANGRQRLQYIAGFNGFGGFLPGETMISNLEAAGAGYLLINANREGRSLPQDPYFNEHAKLIYGNKGVFLYSLNP